MKISCNHIIILLLLASTFPIFVAFAQPELISDDLPPWNPVSDETHPGWDIYARSDICGLEPISFTIANHGEGKFTFDYKIDNADDYLDISLYYTDKKNAKPQKLSFSKNWTTLQPFNVKEEDVLKLEFRVRDNTRKYRIWIAFPSKASNNNGTTLISSYYYNIIPTPSIPKGSIFGYVGEIYNYSTSIEALSLNEKKLNFEFNWGDNRSDKTNGYYSVGLNAELSHAWSQPGEYMVKVKGFNEQDNSGNWSSPLRVIIYQRIDSTDNLQDSINNSSRYTELVLKNKVYIINDLIIHKKYDLRIKSSGGYIDLAKQNLNNNILISDSNYITISNMNISDSKNGIVLENSSYCNISNNKMFFDCSGFGILIKHGGINIIQDNLVQTSSKSQNNRYASRGIIVNETIDNYINNNTIKIIGSEDGLYHYCIRGSAPNNTIIIPDEGKIIIENNGCVVDWASGLGVSAKTKEKCITCDRDLRSGIWVTC